MKRKFASKRTGAIALATMMATSSVTAFAATDTAGHWAEEILNQWSNEGLISGFPDGTMRPDAVVTRAQFVTMLQNVMKFEAKESSSFTDVTEADWFYDAVSAAVSNGITSGFPDGSFLPNNNVTRAQAAVFGANALGITTGGNVSGYTDSSSIPSWAVDAVGAMSDKGFLSGMPDGSFAPNDALTRAQAVSFLERLRQDGGSSSTTTNTSTGTIVTKNGTEFANQTLEGNVTISSEIGDGEVYFDNVVIKGDLIVKGGGDDSIYLKNTKVEGKIIMDYNGVRVHLSGNCSVPNVEILSAGNLTYDSATWAGSVGTITIPNAISTVNKITVDVPATALVVDGRCAIELRQSIGEVVFNKNAGSSTISTTSNVDINELTANAKIVITGKGDIIVLNANVSGITYESTVTIKKTELATGVTAPKETTTSTGTSTGTGTSGGTTNNWWDTGSGGSGSSNKDDDDDNETGDGNEENDENLALSSRIVITNDLNENDGLDIGETIDFTLVTSADNTSDAPTNVKWKVTYYDTSDEVVASAAAETAGISDSSEGSVLIVDYDSSNADNISGEVAYFDIEASYTYLEETLTISKKGILVYASNVTPDSEVVANIGTDKLYMSFAAALADDSIETITLRQNVTGSESYVTLTTAKEIDLNGYEIVDLAVEVIEEEAAAPASIATFITPLHPLTIKNNAAPVQGVDLGEKGTGLVKNFKFKGESILIAAPIESMAVEIEDADTVVTVTVDDGAEIDSIEVIDNVGLTDGDDAEFVIAGESATIGEVSTEVPASIEVAVESVIAGADVTILADVDAVTVVAEVTVTVDDATGTVALVTVTADGTGATLVCGDAADTDSSVTLSVEKIILLSGVEEVTLEGNLPSGNIDLYHDAGEAIQLNISNAAVVEADGTVSGVFPDADTAASNPESLPKLEVNVKDDDLEITTDIGVDVIGTTVKLVLDESVATTIGDGEFAFATAVANVKYTLDTAETDRKYAYAITTTNEAPELWDVDFTDKYYTEVSSVIDLSSVYTINKTESETYYLHIALVKEDSTTETNAADFEAIEPTASDIATFEITFTGIVDSTVTADVTAYEAWTDMVDAYEDAYADNESGYYKASEWDAVEALITAFNTAYEAKEAGNTDQLTATSTLELPEIWYADLLFTKLSDVVYTNGFIKEMIDCISELEKKAVKPVTAVSDVTMKGQEDGSIEITNLSDYSNGQEFTLTRTTLTSVNETITYYNGDDDETDTTSLVFEGLAPATDYIITPEEGVPTDAITVEDGEVPVITIVDSKLGTAITGASFDEEISVLVKLDDATVALVAADEITWTYYSNDDDDDETGENVLQAGDDTATTDSKYTISLEDGALLGGYIQATIEFKDNEEVFVSTDRIEILAVEAPTLALVSDVLTITDYDASLTYKYSFDGGAFVKLPEQTSETTTAGTIGVTATGAIENTADGTYIVRKAATTTAPESEVSDAIDLTAPEAPVILLQTQASDSLAENGTITLDDAGETLTYELTSADSTYKWEDIPSTQLTTDEDRTVITGLTSGSWAVRVKADTTNNTVAGNATVFEITEVFIPVSIELIDRDYTTDEYTVVDGVPKVTDPTDATGNTEITSTVPYHWEMEAEKNNVNLLKVGDLTPELDEDGVVVENEFKVEVSFTGASGTDSLIRSWSSSSQFEAQDFTWLGMILKDLSLDGGDTYVDLPDMYKGDGYITDEVKLNWIFNDGTQASGLSLASATTVEDASPSISTFYENTSEKNKDMHLVWLRPLYNSDRNAFNSTKYTDATDDSKAYTLQIQNATGTETFYTINFTFKFTSANTSASPVTVAYDEEVGENVATIGNTYMLTGYAITDDMIATLSANGIEVVQTDSDEVLLIPNTTMNSGSNSGATEEEFSDLVEDLLGGSTDSSEDDFGSSNSPSGQTDSSTDSSTDSNETLLGGNSGSNDLVATTPSLGDSSSSDSSSSDSTSSED